MFCNKKDMYFNLLLLFSIVKCKMYLIETEDGMFHQVEPSKSSPGETGNDYVDSYETVEADKDYVDIVYGTDDEGKAKPRKKGKHGKKKSSKKKNKIKKSPKSAKGYAQKANSSIETGQDYSDWLDQCSLKTSCSEESCMIQKDIPGCGGSIDLLCTGGCINILKVRTLSQLQISRMWMFSCDQVRYTCRTKDSTPEPSIEQLEVVKKLCKGDRCETVKPGKELFGDVSECPGRNPPGSRFFSNFFVTNQGSAMNQC